MMTQFSSSKSRSDNPPFLYMFNDCIGSRNYILYRIDALEHLRNKPSAAASTCNTQQQLFNLQPLLVFTSLPDLCNCAKLGSMFYFFGGSSTDVYMMKESDVMDIDPNTNGDKYLIETASMKGPKRFPTTVFVAENKLYVLSRRHSNTQFEVFCPRLGTWKLLPPLPDGCEGSSRISYVVVGKTVYFTMSSSRAFLSFNLELEKWVIVARDIPSSLPNYSFSAHLPPSPLVIVGGMAFGFLDAGLCDGGSLSICASPLPQDGDSVYYNFMRPSLAPDDEFMHAIDSSSCPHVFSTDYEIFSQYMVTLDGGKVLCVISYGNGSVPAGDNCQLDFYTSYATLTFFEVTPGFYRDTCRCQANFVYANEMDNGEYVATRHFKAKLLHSAQFIIKNASVHTCGRMKACFSEGL